MERSPEGFAAAVDQFIKTLNRYWNCLETFAAGDVDDSAWFHRDELVDQVEDVELVAAELRVDYLRAGISFGPELQGEPINLLREGLARALPPDDEQREILDLLKILRAKAKRWTPPAPTRTTLSPATTEGAEVVSDRQKKLLDRLDGVIAAGDGLLATVRNDLVDDSALTVWMTNAKTIIRAISPGGHHETDFDKRDIRYRGNATGLNRRVSVLKGLRGDFVGGYLTGSGQANQGTARSPAGTKVVIGHGRSPAWRDLRDLLEDTLGLEVEEFNTAPVAGFTHKERLLQMKAVAGMAFLVMTAEDAQPDGGKRARQNVVHEAGYFQGALEFERAIVLLETGCELFSNADGINYIPFPPGHINSTFEEVRRVLKREGFLK